MGSGLRGGAVPLQRDRKFKVNSFLGAGGEKPTEDGSGLHAGNEAKKEGLLQMDTVRERFSKPKMITGSPKSWDQNPIGKRNSGRFNKSAELAKQRVVRGEENRSKRELL